jgi:hypothetical protein
MTVAIIALFFAITGVGAAAGVELAGKAGTTTVYGPSVTLCSRSRACGIGLSSAACPSGTSPVGGGWVFPIGSHSLPAKGIVIYNGPSTQYKHTHWDGEMSNTESISGGFRAVAICSS